MEMPARHCLSMSTTKTDERFDVRLAVRLGKIVLKNYPFAKGDIGIDLAMEVANHEDH